MNLKITRKILPFTLFSLFIFSACEEDKDSGPSLGEVVGTWKLSSFKGTYDRKVVTKEGVEHSKDKYELIASWKDGEAFAEKTGTDYSVLKASSDQVLATFQAGDDAPGFPRTSELNSAQLEANQINLTTVLFDAPSKGDYGTYTVEGTYPTIRFDEDSCFTYSTVAPITDSGEYTVDVDGNGTAKPSNFILRPKAGQDQVLPPFADGTYSVDAVSSPKTFSLKFLDRDSHDELFSQVQTSFSEADDRVISGINGLPVDSDGAWDSAAEGESQSEAFVKHSSFEPWGGMMTWYAMNVISETQHKISDIKNPLQDLNGDGKIDISDMMLYMISDITNGYGSKTVYGLEYTKLISFSNKLEPTMIDDSGHSFSMDNMDMGGKLAYVIKNGLCIPVNETIDFDTKRVEVPQ